MSLLLPDAPGSYDRVNEQLMRTELQQSDLGNFKKGQDVRLERGERLILKAPDGGLWEVSVDNTGTLTTASV